MPHHQNAPARQFPPGPHRSPARRDRPGPSRARGRLRATGPVLALAAVASCALAGCQGSGGQLHTAGTGGPAPASSAPAPGTSPQGTAGSPSPGASGGSGSGSAAKPLAGKVVAIDPGHNPHNYQHSAEINKQVKVGNGSKECDTTGTSTNAGYSEADFNLDVAHRLRTLLRAQGAKVVLTYDGDRAWGPCVTERAEAGNKAKADAALSIHADGAPVGRRGFHVILPGRVDGGGPGDNGNAAIVAPSAKLGKDLRDAFQRVTGTARSNYIGQGTALDTRTDLGGLNLSTVPKVFIECGNMRDPKDAALLTSAAWRQKAAQGMADGIDSFLK